MSCGAPGVGTRAAQYHGTQETLPLVPNDENCINENSGTNENSTPNENPPMGTPQNGLPLVSAHTLKENRIIRNLLQIIGKIESFAFVGSTQLGLDCRKTRLCQCSLGVGDIDFVFDNFLVF